MDTVLKSVDREPQQQAPTFETQIGDENFDFLAVAFDDAKVTGRPALHGRRPTPG